MRAVVALLASILLLVLSLGLALDAQLDNSGQEQDLTEIKTQIAESIRERTCGGGDQEACDRICIYMSLQDVPGSSCFGLTLHELDGAEDHRNVAQPVAP